jgi:hypothetical protein
VIEVCTAAHLCLLIAELAGRSWACLNFYIVCSPEFWEYKFSVSEDQQLASLMVYSNLELLNFPFHIGTEYVRLDSGWTALVLNIILLSNFLDC